MSLQFVLGDLSVDKKLPLIQHILSIYDRNPEAIIYYIVPEHLKFDMEAFLLKMIQKERNVDRSAMINIQVASFSRLLWFLMPKKNQKSIQVTDTGLVMLVQQILHECADDLVVFRGQIKYQGFAKQLAELFNELYEGHIDTDDLSTLLDDTKGKILPDTEQHPNLQNQRIEELMMLYNKFIESVHHLNIADYQIYEDLHQYLGEIGTLPNHYFIIDHYYYFNAHQMNTVIDLALTSEHVWITLPIQAKYLSSQHYQPMFEMFKQTYHQVIQLCRQFNIPIVSDIDLDKPAFNYSDSILKIADRFKDTHLLQDQINPPTLNNASLDVELKQYDNIQSEIKHISNQIHQLVVMEGYRYQDIQVVARDLSLYQTVIPAYFKMNNIPYFYDHETAMAEHPFVQLIETICNLNTYQAQITDIISFLKSPLIKIPLQETGYQYSEDEIFDETMHRLAIFENILLKNGYYSYRFTNTSFEWFAPDDDLLYVDSLGRTTSITHHEMASYYRTFTLDNVFKAFQAFDKTLTGSEAARWLYDLVKDLNVREAMVALRDQAIEDGDVEWSRQHEQVWDVFVDLLDEFHLLFTELPIDFQAFEKLILIGLTEATYHIIPPTLDQVVVTNMESPQTHPAKICFVIGMDNQTIPKVNERPSLLSQDERLQIREQLLPHQILVDDSQMNISQELFLMYRLLLKATDKIYLSYSVGNLEAVNEISSYLNQLIQMRPLSINIVSDQNIGERSLIESDFGRYSMIRELVMRLYQYQRKYEERPSQTLIQLASLLDSYPYESRRTFQDILKAIQKTALLPTQISSEIAQELFGKNLNLSISNLEQYFQDPYSHFLVYGLRLRERELFEMDSQLSGDYFHDFMDQFIQAILQQYTRLSDLTNQEIKQLQQRINDQLLGQYKYRILESHPRFSAIHLQMNQELLRLIEILKIYDQTLQPKTLATEALFGMNPKYPLKGYSIPLNNGGRLALRGKIDRIDTIHHQDQQYLEVIDYKSSRRSFDLVDVYYGLDLQILAYLDIALNNYSNTQALGGFYQPIRQSTIEGTEETFNHPEARWQSYLEKNRLEGLVTIDSETLKEIDETFELSPKSQIFPVKLKKDGTFDAYSSAYSPEELNVLRHYVRYLFRQAGEAMHNGNISLRPFRDERFTPSLKYPWRIIARFDPTLHFDVYREKEINKKHILDKMKNDLDQNKEGEADDTY
ncbi:PD-(D/E)XK nuclease family protein [Aerococcaceae bacterium DSM 111020]|nr:PD-(D/E)XK nuclease family protein [Aerococcaceae bacterium DSM 111020]